MTTKEKQALIANQVDLHWEIVKEAHINIVNCGSCGSIFLHRTNNEDNVICPFCYENMAKSDCPDYFYTGLEFSGEFEFNNEAETKKQTIIESRELLKNQFNQYFEDIYIPDNAEDETEHYTFEKFYDEITDCWEKDSRLQKLFKMSEDLVEFAISNITWTFPSTFANDIADNN